MSFVAVLLFFVSTVQAARTALVDSDDGVLLKNPAKDSDVIRKLKKGQHMTASNYPTEGYFKVRMPDGTIGWVKSDLLELGPLPDLSHGN